MFDDLIDTVSDWFSDGGDEIIDGGGDEFDGGEDFGSGGEDAGDVLDEGEEYPSGTEIEGESDVDPEEESSGKDWLKGGAMTAANAIAKNFGKSNPGKGKAGSSASLGDSFNNKFYGNSWERASAPKDSVPAKTADPTSAIDHWVRLFAGVK